MITILHVVSSTALSNGVMNCIMNYYRFLDKTKIQFDFLCFKKADLNFNSEINLLDGHIFEVNKPSIKNFFRTYKEFDLFFKNNASKYTAIHLHEIYLIHFIKHFCKKYNIKHLITHAHATKYSDNPKNALRNRIMCLGLNDVATNLFACSKAAGEFYYSKEAVERGKVKIIPNAINLEKYKFNDDVRKNVRKNLNIENKFVVGHIGRMSPQKNQIFLLKVFAEVKKKQDNATLVMIGDGPLRKDIEKEILQLGLKDSVILLGVRDDVPQLLMAMDVFLLPSLFEGLGIVAMEAQASGLKCIMSDVIPKETNVGGAEYLSLQADYKKWAECILKSLDRKIRVDCTANLIKNGYSIKESAIELQKIYTEIIEEKI